jgi:hypothetical protein
VDPGGQLFRISDFQHFTSFGTCHRRLLGSRYCTWHCNVWSGSLQGAVPGPVSGVALMQQVEGWNPSRPTTHIRARLQRYVCGHFAPRYLYLALGKSNVICTDPLYG